MKKIWIFLIVIVIILLFFIASFLYNPYKSILLWNPVVKYFGKDKNLDDMMKNLYNQKEIFINEFINAQLFHNEIIKPTSSINKYEEILSGADFYKWKTAPVRYMGHWRNQDIFPDTIKILNQYDYCLSNTYFSIMEPGKILPFHYGLYAGTQRIHIPLIIPPGNASLELLDGTMYSWNNGPFWFHDYKYHRAWNLTEGQRVVLIIDIIMDLPPVIKQINDLMFIAATNFSDRMIN